MNNFKFNNYSAYILNETEDGIYISNCLGFIMEEQQMIDVAHKLINFANIHGDEIKEYNKKNKIDFDKMMNQSLQSNKTNGGGYIYFIKCNDKYKIGYSKDVEKRIKTLDDKPFKIELITNSNYLSRAYLIEQKLHSKYKEFNINGEWYSFSENEIEEIKNILNNIMEDNYATFF